MKSQVALDLLTEEIKYLQGCRKIIEKYPQTQLYFSATPLSKIIVRIKAIHLLEASWRHKFVCEILASTTQIFKYSSINALRLRELFDDSDILTPVAVKDLPLYMYMEFKTPLFAQIIKTGKLPKNKFS